MCVWVPEWGWDGWARTIEEKRSIVSTQSRALELLNSPIHFHVEILLKAFYYDYQ